MNVQVIGIAWYKKEHFEELRRIFEDGDKLHRTHHEWLTAAEQLRKRLEAQGTRVVRAYINPAEFAEWCASKGYKLNAKARNEFANLAAYRSVSRSH